MRTLITLMFVALALPAAAAAGGWATAGLGSPPAGIEPGETWRAELTLLQHGVTPLDGVRPTLTITGPGTQTFQFTPTGKPGGYVAEVVFPSAGTWRYRLDDGFSQVHTFAPIQVGAPAITPTPIGGSGGGFPVWAIAPIVAGALGLAALGVALLRRRGAGVPLPH